MKQSGCLDCKERYIGCHSKCDKYKNYINKLTKIKENREQQKKLYPKYKKSKCI